MHAKTGAVEYNSTFGLFSQRRQMPHASRRPLWSNRHNNRRWILNYNHFYLISISTMRFTPHISFFLMQFFPFIFQFPLFYSLSANYPWKYLSHFIQQLAFTDQELNKSSFYSKVAAKAPYDVMAHIHTQWDEPRNLVTHNNWQQPAECLRRTTGPRDRALQYEADSVEEQRRRREISGTNLNYNDVRQIKRKSSRHVLIRSRMWMLYGVPTDYIHMPIQD